MQRWCDVENPKEKRHSIVKQKHQNQGRNQIKSNRIERGTTQSGIAMCDMDMQKHEMKKGRSRDEHV